MVTVSLAKQPPLKNFLGKIGRSKQIKAGLIFFQRWSTNGGNIRPACTVFPPREAGEEDPIRIWNKVSSLTSLCHFFENKK